MQTTDLFSLLFAVLKLILEFVRFFLFFRALPAAFVARIIVARRREAPPTTHAYKPPARPATWPYFMPVQSLQQQCQNWQQPAKQAARRPTAPTNNVKLQNKGQSQSWRGQKAAELGYGWLRVALG